jgi:acyl-coenzyme A thioesterase PaaI-like protein
MGHDGCATHTIRRPAERNRVVTQPTPVNAQWPGHCFGCSPRNPHGLRLLFQRTGRGCRSRHVLAPHYCGVEGIAHGGMVGTLLDETAAWAIILHTGKLGLTTTMTTRFAAPVKIGVDLDLEAVVLHQDGRRASTRAWVRDDEGLVLAEAESEWALASAAVVSRMSGLPRQELEAFFAAASPAP